MKACPDIFEFCDALRWCDKRTDFVAPHFVHPAVPRGDIGDRLIRLRGLLRADLARRQGVDMISVSDAQINGWLAERNINAQFVYNFHDLEGESTELLSYPDEVPFLLYAAGTWVRGSQDVITLDTVYDSQTLRQNDYTALFTEEGYLVAQRGHDSRFVTVPVCPSGSTHIGEVIACNGTITAGGSGE